MLPCVGIPALYLSLKSKSALKQQNIVVAQQYASRAYITGIFGSVILVTMVTVLIVHTLLLWRQIQEHSELYGSNVEYDASNGEYDYYDVVLHYRTQIITNSPPYQLTSSSSLTTNRGH